MRVNGVHIDLSKQTVEESARAAKVSVATLIRRIREEADAESIKDAKSELREKYAWERRLYARKENRDDHE